METVKALVEIPGLLEKGDILISASEGEDFVTGEITKNANGQAVSRSATIDYYSVCASIPTYFTWVIDDEDVFEPDLIKEARDIDEYNQELDFYFNRSPREIADRYDFFIEKATNAKNKEEKVVFNNLIWFIDWLTGKAELLK